MKNIGLSNSIEAIYKSKQAYDRSCKIILRNQDILAEILKEFVVEYKGLSRREIIDNYLSRRKEFNLDYDDNEIPSDNIEDDSVDGARVNYDLVYSLIAPTSSGDNIGIIVNIEAQNRYGLKYDIEDRATYYASRLIARQKGPRTVLNVNDYAELKKVYSIWICTNSSKAEQNSILDLRLKPDIRIGNPKIKEVYDLINISIINLGNDIESNLEILSILNILFDIHTKLEYRKNFLEQHDIIMSKEQIDEVDNMANLSDYIELTALDKGRKQGHEKGLAEGIEKGKVELLKLIIDNILKSSPDISDEELAKRICIDREIITKLRESK